VTDAQTAKSRFTYLHSQRGEVISRAEEAARITIPSLIPKSGHNENSRLPTPYQGLGARLVNNLGAKLLLALFPPNTAFFKFSLDAEVEEQLRAEGFDISEQMDRLGKVERTIIAEHEQTKARPVLFHTMKLLIVGGNALLHVDKDGQYRVFDMRHYVVSRDHAGNVIEIVVRESIAPSALPKNLDKVVELTPEERADPRTEIDVYTWIVRDGGKYRIHQEMQDKHVPGSAGTMPLDSPAFIPLRWSAVPGEDYGRGLVEEYQGDFNAYDDLSRDLLKASANAAKVIFMRKPNSTVRKKDLAAAQSGDILDGDPDDVGTLGLDKFADFRITFDRIKTLREELAAAFLMNSSVQRQAERVTAEEIRYVAQELEDALGGIYSTLAQELLAPLVRRLMSVLARRQKIPFLPTGDLKVTITTGIDALGRGHELNKLISVLRVLGEVVGPEAVMQRLKFENVERRVSTQMGVDTKDLFKTEQEVAQDREADMQAGIAGDAIPPMLQQAMKGAMNG
jgi:Bacteriophage head to tail connecting protein